MSVPAATSRPALSISSVPASCAAAALALTCVVAQPAAPEPSLPTQPPGASPSELRVLGGRTDYSLVKPQRASPQELPVWRIPNVP